MPIWLWVIDGLLWSFAIFFIIKGSFEIFIKSRMYFDKAVLDDRAAHLHKDDIDLEKRFKEAVEDYGKYEKKYEDLISQQNEKRSSVDEMKYNQEIELYKSLMENTLKILEGLNASLEYISKEKEEVLRSFGIPYSKRSQITAAHRVAYAAAYFALSSFFIGASALIAAIYVIMR